MKRISKAIDKRAIAFAESFANTKDEGMRSRGTLISVWWLGGISYEAEYSTGQHRVFNIEDAKRYLTERKLAATL